SFHKRLRKSGLFSQLFEVSGRDLIEQILAADLHSHFLAQLGVIERTDKIIEWSKSHVVLPCAVEQREVLSVGIVIANKVIEDSRIEHALQVDDGSTGNSAQEIEALFEGRPTFTLIFVFGNDT